MSKVNSPPVAVLKLTVSEALVAGSQGWCTPLTTMSLRWPPSAPVTLCRPPSTTSPEIAGATVCASTVSSWVKLVTSSGDRSSAPVTPFQDTGSSADTGTSLPSPTA